MKSLKVPPHRSIFFQLGLTITALICVIEAVIFAQAHEAKKQELARIREVVAEQAEIYYGKRPNASLLPDSWVSRRMKGYNRYILGVILLVVFGTVVGTLTLFYFLAGRHILRLKEMNEKTTASNIVFYPPSDVPVNEVGAVILSRDEMLREWKAGQNSIIQAAKLTAIGEMTSGVVHEINNPLAIVLGFSEQMRILMKDREGVEDLDNCVTKIETSAKRIDKIVKNVLSYSRNRSGEDMEYISFDALAEEASEFCEPNLSKYRVELRNLAKGHDIQFRCRPTQISQVVVNLINNACHAIADLDERWISVECAEHGDTITVMVTDSGSGITPELGKKILQPFFTTKPEGKGTGLGLSVSQQVIEQHGGQLFIDFDHHHTRFIFNIPKDGLEESSPEAA